MNAALAVWWDERRIGALRLNEMSFAYSPDWLADPSAPPLSVSLLTKAMTSRCSAL